jgi:hypothetical protein
MICKDGERIKLVPLLEVNPRMTMGQVAQKLDKRVCRAHPAQWLFLGHRDLTKLGIASFSEFSLWCETHAPVTMGENQVVRSGIFFTTDPFTVTSLVTCVAVGDSLKLLKKLGSTPLDTAVSH